MDAITFYKLYIQFYKWLFEGADRHAREKTEPILFEWVPRLLEASRGSSDEALAAVTWENWATNYSDLWPRTDALKFIHEDMERILSNAGEYPALVRYRNAREALQRTVSDMHNRRGKESYAREWVIISLCEKRDREGVLQQLRELKPNPSSTREESIFGTLVVRHTEGRIHRIATNSAGTLSGMSMAQPMKPAYELFKECLPIVW